MEEKGIIRFLKEQAKTSKNAYEWMESLPEDVARSISEQADAVKRSLEWAKSLPDADQNDDEDYTH